MKLSYFILTLLIIGFLPSQIIAQKSSWNKIRKADRLRTFGRTEKALKKYESILTENPNNPEANFQVGKINLLDIEDFGKAEKHLSQSINSFGEKDTIYMAYYYLAGAQKLMGNFPSAIENYNFFKTHGIKDAAKAQDLISDVNEKIDECKVADTYFSDDKYTFTKVINLGDKVNSELSEYCSIFFPKTDQLMYTARYKDSDKEKRFMDFKFFEGGYSLSDTSLISGEPNRLNFNNSDKSHFSVVSKTTSGDTVIFYKNNKLWLSKKENGNFSEPTLLPEAINRSYYQPHGTFSPDNKYFIFSSSDKKIQLDLYRIEVVGNNSWGTAEILPANINSKDNEDSPYFSDDGQTLYFSSNKSGGFGKYDIYFSKLQDGIWGNPLNMGMPINSPGEDIFFSLNPDKKTGFLSSNRGGGFGSMDIYMFTEQPYPSFDCDEYLAANGNVGKNEIIVLDELVMKEIVRFDVSDAKIDNADISNVFWKVGDKILKLDSPLLTYSFDESGVYSVTTQIYGKDKETDEYVMDCSTQSFQILEEGPLFLEIETDKMVKVEENAIIDAAMFYLGDNRMITDYKWFIDGTDIGKNKQSYNYAFQDTGLHTIEVLVTVVDQVKNESFSLSSKKEIFVYDESHALQVDENGLVMNPGLDLLDNSDKNTGKVNALKADLYGVPDDRRVFYSWYIDNAEVKGRQTELLEYDFKPLSTVKVVATVLEEEEEPEFKLQASKVIPDFGSVDVVAADNTTITKPDPSVVVTTPDPIAVTNPDATEVGNVDAISYKIQPVYFLFDKYYLTTKAKATINNNIAALKANPSLKILVEGNTDSMGPSSYNLRLSEKRAKSVYNYLKKNGITDKQIDGINSNGEKLPKAPNTANGKDNPSGRQENRRVDFTIVTK